MIINLDGCPVGNGGRECLRGCGGRHSGVNKQVLAVAAEQKRLEEVLETPNLCATIDLEIRKFLVRGESAEIRGN